MSDGEEWGPWIDHDGMGCPCVGMLIECVALTGHGDYKLIGPYVAKGLESWTWGIHKNPPSVWWHVLAYRISKPRALRDMIEMVENLPVPERVDA